MADARAQTNFSMHRVLILGNSRSRHSPQHTYFDLQVFRGKGLADEAIVFILAALPVLELRGAIPVGVWLGMPVAKVPST